MRRQYRDCLGVGLSLEVIAERGQLAAQRLIVFDDAVVDDSYAIGGYRMGVGLGREAMRRPARVPDPDRPVHWFIFEAYDKMVELTLGPSSFDASIDQRRDPSRIITAVLEPA